MEEKQEAHQQAFPAWYSLCGITQLGALTQQLPFPSLQVPSTTSLLTQKVKHYKIISQLLNLTPIDHLFVFLPLFILEFKISFISILKTLLIP